MSLCVLAGGKVAVVAASAFTLAWTHSIEKTGWEEDWQVTPAGLHLVEARVKGSGAGMEPPPDARLENGWFVWNPNLPAQTKLTLAASGATGAGWSLCAAENCLSLGDVAGEPVTVEACDG